MIASRGLGDRRERQGSDQQRQGSSLDDFHVFLLRVEVFGG